MTKSILEQLFQAMPSLITRTHPQFKTWTGIGGRRMANLDSLGQGPKERVLLWDGRLPIHGGRFWNG
jgi:hypothetical protein